MECHKYRILVKFSMPEWIFIHTTQSIYHINKTPKKKLPDYLWSTLIKAVSHTIVYVELHYHVIKLQKEKKIGNNVKLTFKEKQRVCIGKKNCPL